MLMSRYSLAPVRLLVVVIVLSAGGVCPAASFPFNGSFEFITAGRPLGWNVEGAWFVRPDAATEGRNGISVFGDFGQRGAQLSTSGYLLVRDEPLSLSLTYSSPTGNVSCGLEFCDRLGRPLAVGAWEALPAATTRTHYQREIVLPQTIEMPAPPAPVATPAVEPAEPAAPPVAAPADAAAPGEVAAAPPTPSAPQEDEVPAAPEDPQPATLEVAYDSVRLVFRIDADGAQIRFDNVKLTHGGRLSARPAAPKIKAESRPNLLPSGGFALGGECDPRGWTALQDAHHAPELATALPELNFLSLEVGHGKGAAWLADPVLLDGALPYRLQGNVNAGELQDGRLQMLIALVDPQDDRAVWLQQEQTVPAGENGVVDLVLPRLWTTAGAVRARVGFEVPPVGAGQAQVRSAALCPEPLSLSVRSAAVSGGFKRPTDVQLFVSAVNNTYAALKPKAVLQVRDANGKAVAGETRAIIIGSRSAAYFPYKPKLTGVGSYRLLVRIVNGGVELGSTEYEFRVGELPAAEQ